MNCVRNVLACIFSFNLIELYVVVDERDRRRGSHLLLEGEFTLSPDGYFNLPCPIYILHGLLTMKLQGVGGTLKIVLLHAV